MLIDCVSKNKAGKTEVLPKHTAIGLWLNPFLLPASQTVRAYPLAVLLLNRAVEKPLRVYLPSLVEKSFEFALPRFFYIFNFTFFCFPKLNVPRLSKTSIGLTRTLLFTPQAFYRVYQSCFDALETYC